MLEPEVTEVKATCPVKGGIADITLTFSQDDRHRRQVSYVVDLPNGRRSTGRVDAAHDRVSAALKVSLHDALEASTPPRHAEI